MKELGGSIGQENQIMSSNDMRFIDHQNGKSFDLTVHPETSENVVVWMTKDRPKLTAASDPKGLTGALRL